MMGWMKPQPAFLSVNLVIATLREKKARGNAQVLCDSFMKLDSSDRYIKRCTFSLSYCLWFGQPDTD